MVRDLFEWTEPKKTAPILAGNAFMVIFHYLTPTWMFAAPAVLGAFCVLTEKLKALDAGTARIPESDHDLAFGRFGVRRAPKRGAICQMKPKRPRLGRKGTWYAVAAGRGGRGGGGAAARMRSNRRGGRGGPQW